MFPPAMRKILREQGRGFLDKCPRADDIWLNLTALRSGFPVKQVVLVPKRFYEVPGTREGALASYNNGQGGNDVQLQKTYTADDVSLLQRSEFSS